VRSRESDLNADEPPTQGRRAFFPLGFYLVIAGQFVSAFADNALLIIAIARLIELGLPGWWAPLLKFWFTLSYVVLAPWVGPLSDSVPKARLMAWMNGLKFIGAALLLTSVQPLLAFAIVGVASAANAPAKYGIISELVPARRLVRGNAWMEVAVTCAVLGGTVAGGLLVSSWFLGLHAAGVAQHVAASLIGHVTEFALPLLLMLACYALSAALNFGVRKSGVPYAKSAKWARPAAMLREFFAANRLLWNDRAAGLSLAVTAVFWGAAATLQFVVLRWAQQSLQMHLDQAAYLQGIVAVGVVAGAALAGRWVRLHNATRVLPLGVAMGLLIPGLIWVNDLAFAVALLLLVGVCAGFFLVPMNALLQHRGRQLITPGRSIAVQGFNENVSVMTALGVYAALLAAEIPLNTLLLMFGGAVAALMGLLVLREWRYSTVTSP